MATQVQFRGGTTTEHSSFTGVAKEVTVDTTKKTLVVHDGATVGGVPLATEAAVNGKVGLTGNETVAGTKTFSSTITGSITGNAGTVTNGVYTSGDQTIGGVKTLSSNPIVNAGTANGVAFLNASKVLTTGSALTFDGTNLGVNTASPQNDTTYGGLTINGGNGSILTFRAGNANSGRIYTTNIDNLNIDANGSTSGNIIFRLGTGSTEQMRLTSTGLGIGTTSPGDKLEIGGAGAGIILASPNGTRYRLTVNNPGVLTVAAV